MIVEVIHGFLRGFQETERFGFERKPDRAARAPGDVDEPRCHLQHVIGVAGDHVRPCDPGLESKRCALDGRRRSFRRHFSENFRDIHGVLRSFFRTPVRLVDLFLDLCSLEWSVRERIHRVEIHVVAVEKVPEFDALGGICDQRLCRRIG